jgi:hypothetical protein
MFPPDHSNCGFKRFFRDAEAIAEAVQRPAIRFAAE